MFLENLRIQAQRNWTKRKYIYFRQQGTKKTAAHLLGLLKIPAGKWAQGRTTLREYPEFLCYPGLPQRKFPVSYYVLCAPGNSPHEREY